MHARRRPSADFDSADFEGLRSVSSSSAKWFWNAPSSSGYISASQTARAGRASSGATARKYVAMSSASTTAEGAGKIISGFSAAPNGAVGRPQPSNLSAAAAGAWIRRETRCRDRSR